MYSQEIIRNQFRNASILLANIDACNNQTTYNGVEIPITGQPSGADLGRLVRKTSESMLSCSNKWRQLGLVGQSKNPDEYRRNVRNVRNAAQYLIQLFDNISALVTMMDLGQDQSVLEMLSNMSQWRARVQNFGNALSAQLEAE